MAVSITFSRLLVTGSPVALVIPAAPGGAYWIDEGSIIEPEIEHRITFADESPHVAGALPTQSVRALGTLGLTVYTLAASDATLTTQKRALEAVVSQYTYTGTLTLHGTDVYTCLPARLSWGVADSGMVRGLIARGVLTIPTQPLAV